jgi:hypothetical protein
MRPKNEIEDELHYRIMQDLEYYNSQLPDTVIIAWRAYLGALLEWNILSIKTYDKLVKLMPSVEDDPSISILSGREN